MATNVERFKEDLEKLISLGGRLELAMQFECFPERLSKAVANELKKRRGEKVDHKTDEKADEKAGKKVTDSFKVLPSFKETYQRWYSEAIAVLRQLLPDRLADFVRHYEKPKPRKDLTNENYRIEDYLQGLSVTNNYTKEKMVGPEAAISHFQQQLAIVKAAKARFESSLFEIRQLVQADLFDSELEAAEGLNKYKFTRAAGALAGVVLEGHLVQVCSDRKLTVSKKNPGIADLNEVLKSGGVIDVPTWRFIQHLADIRNLCDHSKEPAPTAAQVTDLIDGVKKVIKTVF